MPFTLTHWQNPEKNFEAGLAKWQKMTKKQKIAAVKEYDETWGKEEIDACLTETKWNPIFEEDAYFMDYIAEEVRL